MMDRTASISGKETEGFTPVRRLLSTINSRQYQGDPEKEWTAARCNRLLRALQSRVAILNKDLSRVQPAVPGRDTAAGVRAGTVRKADADADADWNQARKKVKRTYSTRGGRTQNDTRGVKRIRKLQASNEKRPFIPGEVSVPTPILHRVRGEIGLSASSDSSAVPEPEIGGQALRPNKRTKAKDILSDSQLSQTLRDFRKQTTSTRYAIYEGIYNGLDTLLKATNVDGPSGTRTGSKSLLSICLRAVPRYIAHEEELFVAHTEETKSKSAINNRDISTEIYDELEDFGCNGRGWKHFRTIVRSHGIQLISDAIRAGSLDDEFVAILINQCIHTKATEEAEILLSTLLSTTKFPAPKSVFNRFDDDSNPIMRPLSMLWKFVEITGSSPFQYRQLSALLSTGILPLSWLATKELGPVWTRAIQALSTGSSDTDALRFMDTVLPLLVQAGDLTCGDDLSNQGGDLMLDAMKQTFSSLLTTLSSIVILSGEAAEQSQDRSINMHRTEYKHFVTLVQSCSMQWKLSNTRNIQGTLLVITNLLLGDVDRQDSGAETDLTETLLSHLHQMGKSSSILPSYHEVVSFVCSMARCCGRGASNSGFEYLQNLHQKLESIIIRGSEGRDGNVVREILADSALAFAQEIPDRRYLDYVDVMEAKVHRIDTKPRVSLTPRHSLDNSRAGFRWEEGISEWVTATPFLSTKKCQDFTNQTECETPLRPTFQRKFKTQALPNMRTRGRQSSVSIPASVPPSESVESSPAGRSPSSGLDYGDDAIIGAFAENESFDESEDDLSSHGSRAHSLDNLYSSDEEPRSEATEQDPSDVEDSSDELQPSSPQSDPSHVFEQASSPRSEGSLVDESFTSVSSTNSFRSEEPGSGRRHIDRVPRLSRRVLRRSLQWQLFDDDESNDELSFVSVSSGGVSALQDITNNAGSRTTRQQQEKSGSKQASIRQLDDSLLGDSEDELCI